MNKTTLKYHVILVTKYRKPILDSEVMNCVIETLKEKMKLHKCNIITARGDQSDHIHFMIELNPTQSVSLIIKLMKQYSSYYAWQAFPGRLRKNYCYKNLFCSGLMDIFVAQPEMLQQKLLRGTLTHKEIDRFIPSPKGNGFSRFKKR